MCHICLQKLSNYDYMIKCKLCCDGLEQDVCQTCNSFYSRFKYAYFKSYIVETGTLFDILQLRRSNGIKLQQRIRDGIVLSIINGEKK